MMSRVWLFVCLSVLVTTVAGVPGSCPSCDDVDRPCITDLVCGPGEEFRESQNICNCCPGCVKVLVLNDFCNPNFSAKCGNGLECDPIKLVCVVKNGTCSSYTNPSFKPTCLTDGSWGPKQCKGEKLTGRCFCYGGDGTRLFGQEWWSKSENMTCACSRKIWELQKKRTDVTLHCNDVGNYEELQCDDGLCWCAEELTGEPITAVVPDGLIDTLPCYNATVIGFQYLRQCESSVIAQARIGIKMKDHGTNYIRSSQVNCDADGSYGSFQIENNQICYCSWKDSSRLGTWATNVAAMQGVNCNCARDWRYYKESGLDLSLVCNGNGNYEPAQQSEGLWYCVDTDGFPTTEPVAIAPGFTIQCPSY